MIDKRSCVVSLPKMLPRISGSVNRQFSFLEDTKDLLQAGSDLFAISALDYPGAAGHLCLAPVRQVQQERASEESASSERQQSGKLRDGQLVLRVGDRDGRQEGIGKV